MAIDYSAPPPKYKSFEPLRYQNGKIAWWPYGLAPSIALILIAVGSSGSYYFLAVFLEKSAVWGFGAGVIAGLVVALIYNKVIAPRFGYQRLHVLDIFMFNIPF